METPFNPNTPVSPVQTQCVLSSEGNPRAVHFTLTYSCPMLTSQLLIADRHMWVIYFSYTSNKPSREAAHASFQRVLHYTRHKQCLHGRRTRDICSAGRATRNNSTSMKNSFRGFLPVYNTAGDRQMSLAIIGHQNIASGTPQTNQ